MIAGLDGVTFGHGIAINGANGVTIRNLDIAGPVSVTGSNQVRLAEDTFHSHVTVSNATAIFIRDDRFLAADQGLVIASASTGEIRDNVFVGSNQGLVVNAAFAGPVIGNDISGASIGVVYGATVSLSGNRIHNNVTGLSTSIADPTAALGFFPGSGPNDIYQNTIGIQMAGAKVAGQHIFGNATGVSGSGTLGGSDMSGANVIVGNQTGVGAFSGLVQYNRIEGNGVGIAATAGYASSTTRSWAIRRPAFSPPASATWRSPATRSAHSSATGCGLSIKRPTSS